MKKNYLLAGILILALLSFLGIGAVMDAAAAQVLTDTLAEKPTLKASNTPLPKPTNTPTNTPTDTPTPLPTDTPTVKPTVKATNTPGTK